MSDKNNGGPAFPLPHGAETVDGTDGMSLRDYFAAKAMQSLISEPSGPSVLPAENVIARSSYLMADAMLKAREGQ